jgi:hypothetical protein
MTALPERRRTASLLLGLLLAGVTLAGCHPTESGARPTPPTSPTPPPAATQAPRPAGGPLTPLGGCGQALSGVGHSVEGPRARRFEVTRRQLAVIDSRLIEVLCRQGLWQQDVGFGFNYEKDPNRAFVLINPGRSRLTARQILDRLLGRG